MVLLSYSVHNYTLDRNSAINATIIIASKKGIQEFYRKFVWKKRLEIPSKFHSFFANKFWCANARSRGTAAGSAQAENFHGQKKAITQKPI